MIRLSPEEYERLTAIAKRRGLALGTFMRTSALEVAEKEEARRAKK